MNYLKITVQKYGGTSLATPELRAKVCDIIRNSVDDGYNVVVVVSAIGRDKDPYATDTLLNLARSINPLISNRELDYLMACGETISGIILAAQLATLGLETQFLNGEQAGIVTDGNYGDAHILYVNKERIVNALNQGVIPIVAGFQGVSETGELTTLGRGGSDTTASALGVALNADFIDIFTDVEGVMTADPRIVDNARLLNEITYNEICQLAHDGAKIVHPRAIEIAMRANIPLRIRSTFNQTTGTLVTNKMSNVDNIRIINDTIVTGVTYSSDLSQFNISLVKDDESKGLLVFKALALANISVDFINIGTNDIKFTVPYTLTSKTEAVLKNMDILPEVELGCAKVAVVGAAMMGIPGVMAKVIEALSKKDIPIIQSGDSYTNIWCLIKKEYMTIAIKALHDIFELGK